MTESQYLEALERLEELVEKQERGEFISISEKKEIDQLQDELDEYEEDNI